MPGLTGYFGGKNAMSSWIKQYIPKDIKTYAEPFSGSFAVYFNEDFSMCDEIIYNDFNKLQSNFMMCCAKYDKMLDEIYKSFESGFLKFDGYDFNANHTVPFERIKKHYRDLYTKTKNPEFDDFYDNMDFNMPNYDKAVIYAFMITSAFNACHARGAGFSGFSKSQKLKLTTLMNKLSKQNYRDKLDAITTFEYLDFEDLINKYDSEDTFYYVDAPYKHTDGKGTHDKDYGSKDIFGDESHERLANALKKIKAKWALSYYWFEELEKWFPRNQYHWFNKEFFRSSASFSNKTAGNEILILNYDPKNM